MPWTAACVGLRTHLGRARSRRMAHRALMQELADYDTLADRDELVALIAGRGHGDCEVARILAGQAYADLFRDGGPALRH
ncbi:MULTISPECIES: hypothetical protein [unclassified Geodermatophilus]|uniref:hypothetical protein n=1 Tax=unclassified Geodermatophilus TaxID=2637632 RepID=UPI003EE825BE